ncbi:MAG: undecaprenyl-diphosphate phosphatase [Candidatus Brockarchaeota archaeon]|nr:undecaprenyl-diphosphate phosphatase [Candidatus Brockarchaeota archaeon]MBO3808003.1 undecaprenyl-diphosphate phosphatase [Candidatus Brockarchaeota archaeon]
MVHRKNKLPAYILINCPVINLLIILVEPILTIRFPSGSADKTGILKVFFLSLVQGITEWFPISSTGHLVVVQELLKINVSVAFDVMLHLGTLVGVILFLREDLQSVLKAALRLDFSEEEGRMLIYLVLGTIPVGLVGFFLKSFFESMFKSLFATGVAMLLNSLILFSTRLAKPRRRLNALDSFLIGVSQAAAITPGISRIGITVSTGLLLGIDNDEAYRFSLLLSIPSIIGGSLVKLQEVSFEQEYWMIALGILVTAAVGYIALGRVKKYVVKQSFHKFAYYCLSVGAIILLLSILQIS